METRAARIGSSPDGERLVPLPHVVAAAQGGRTVLLDVEHGRYYTLDEVGGRIWQLLGEGRTRAAIVEALRSEYDVEASRVEADVEALFAQLREAGLVE